MRNRPIVNMTVCAKEISQALCVLIEWIVFHLLIYQLTEMSKIFLNEISRCDINKWEKCLYWYNCPTHLQLTNKNINQTTKILFFTSECSFVQYPINQGVIRCFKTNFRRLLELQFIGQKEHFSANAVNKSVNTVVTFCF